MADETPKEDSKRRQLSEAEKDDTGASSESSYTKRHRRKTSRHGSRQGSRLSGRMSSRRSSSRRELKSPTDAAPEASSSDAEQFAGFSWTSPESDTTISNEESRLKSPSDRRHAGTSETTSPEKLATRAAPRKTPSDASDVDIDEGAASAENATQPVPTNQWLSTDLTGAVSDESAGKQQTRSVVTSAQNWAKASVATGTETNPKPAEMHDTGSSETSPQQLLEKSTVACDGSSPTTEARFARSSETSPETLEGKSTAKTSDQSSPTSAEKISETKSDMASHELTVEPAGREQITSGHGTSPREPAQKSPIYSSDETISETAEERVARSQGLPKASEASTSKPSGKHRRSSTATSPWKSPERSNLPYDVSASKTPEERTAGSTPATPLRSILKSGKASGAGSPKPHEKQDTASTSPRKSVSTPRMSRHHSDFNSAKHRSTRSISTSPITSIKKTTKRSEESSEKLGQKRDARRLPTSPDGSADRVVVIEGESAVKLPTDGEVDTCASEAISAAEDHGHRRKPCTRSVGTSPIDWGEATPAKSPDAATSDDATGVDSDALSDRKKASSLAREREFQQEAMRQPSVRHARAAAPFSRLALRGPGARTPVQPVAQRHRGRLRGLSQPRHLGARRERIDGAKETRRRRAHSAVPSLKSGLPWPVYERDGVSRNALWPNSSEETIGEAANEICSRTRAFAQYLY